jgi:hypothetical protein
MSKNNVNGNMKSSTLPMVSTSSAKGARQMEPSLDWTRKTSFDSSPKSSISSSLAIESDSDFWWGGVFCCHNYGKEKHPPTKKESPITSLRIVFWLKFFFWKTFFDLAHFALSPATRSFWVFEILFFRLGGGAQNRTYGTQRALKMCRFIMVSNIETERTVPRKRNSVTKLSIKSLLECQLCESLD